MSQATPAPPIEEDHGLKRQCGRCRQWFEADPKADAVGLADWWACPPCHESLFPNRPAARS